MTDSRRLEKPSMGKIIAVIGTDTEVGKTIITASLARALANKGLRVGVFKPFACDPSRRITGEPFSADAELLARAAGMEGGSEVACGQLFRAPLSPLAAARMEGKRVDVPLALRQARQIAAEHGVTFVEGCGGWEVPLTEKETTADYFAKLRAPILIVARAGLGTLNHSLLTIQAVQRRKLPILGVILNQTTTNPMGNAESTNPAILKQFSGLPVWGPLPYAQKLYKRMLWKTQVHNLHPLGEIADDLLKLIEPQRRATGGVAKSSART